MKTILVTDHDYTFISFVPAFPTRNKIAIRLQPKNFSKILFVLLLRYIVTREEILKVPL